MIRSIQPSTCEAHVSLSKKKIDGRNIDLDARHAGQMFRPYPNFGDSMCFVLVQICNLLAILAGGWAGCRPELNFKGGSPPPSTNPSGDTCALCKNHRTNS